MGWFGEGLFLLLVLVGLVALIVLLIRAANGGSHRTGAATQPGSKQPTAREILDMRYARGELTQDEYATMKRTLAE